MKRELLAFAFQCLAMAALAQPDKVVLPDHLRSIFLPLANKAVAPVCSFNKTPDDLVEFNWPPEITVGTSFYDLQSECSAPSGRMAIFNDGTLGVVWTFAQDTLTFSDKGTGYSYFDGSIWSTFPVSRIESVSTYSPSIAMLGSGEIIAAARSSAGPLRICSRASKGTGAWTESDLPLPQGTPGLISPKMVTSGLGHTVIHILSLTSPVSQGGELYHGQDGALVYQRSSDGGATWEINGFVPAEMDSSHYNGFFPDTYAFAEPQGNKLAFVAGDSWSDLFLMKSDDSGATWQKTVIWQHPVPDWNGEATDSIYCPDGSVHLAFDHTGNIHVVFGLTRLFSDGSQVFRFPYIGGIGHWKEGLPVWTGGDQLNCLNPDSLDIQGRLVCNFLTDWNGNGTLDILGNFGEYKVGPVSFPQIAFDQYGTGMVVMSAITEGYDNGVQDYRHIWYKYFYMGEFGNILFDYNDQPDHMFHECVYPSLGSRSPDNLGWPFIYQLDDSPGLAVTGDQDPFVENLINKVDLEYMLPVIFLTVALTPDPAEGGIVSGGGSVPNGSTVTIEAHAKPGWEFVNWTSQDVLFSTDSVCTFQAIWNYSLVAHFRLIIGISDNVLKGVFVSPNPAGEFLNITFPPDIAGQQVFIQLFSMVGNTVYTSECLVNGIEKVDVSCLAAGVYLLKVQSVSGRKFMTRIIIS